MPFTAKLAAIAATVAATVIAASPALADPISSSGKPITPAAYDVVGVGGGPAEYLLDQLSSAYDSTHKAHDKTHPYIYSWDSTNPKTGALYGNVTLKRGCPSTVRPNSPDIGLSLLHYGTRACEDFSTADRNPTSADPTSLTFVALAQDNVTYATQQVSNAPHNLTTQDLREIYTCAVTNWDQFKGGKNGKIAAFLPLAGSLTTGATPFLQAIGLAAPGPCVSQPDTLAENVGTSKLLDSKNAVVPYSAADFLAQRYHSAACGHQPARSQIQFGCNVSGTLRLNSINGTSPITGSGADAVLNRPASMTRSGFSEPFVTTMYDVVRGTRSIPSYLQGFFGPDGFFCSAAAQKIIEEYGFEAHIVGFASCGVITPG